MNKERLQFPKDISGIQGSILGAINETIYMCYLENNGIIITDYYNRYLWQLSLILIIHQIGLNH